MPSTYTSAPRDPIRNSPLRDPGQLLREQIRDRFQDPAIAWLIVTLLLFLMAIVEWIRWLTNANYMPLQLTSVAAATGIFALWRIRRAIRESAQWKLGLNGERFIGQFLQAELLPRNYFVIHDICVNDANIDHAVIGPRGVFAIEVKTHSKPGRGEARVAYDGKRVLVNGYPSDRDPLNQARAQAKNLQQILEDRTGRKVSVRPVVLYPEWFVDEPAGADVWVLNEKRFLGYIEHEPIRFTDEQARELANGLMRYVREHLEK